MNISHIDKSACCCQCERRVAWIVHQIKIDSCVAWTEKEGGKEKTKTSIWIGHLTWNKIFVKQTRFSLHLQLPEKEKGQESKNKLEFSALLNSKNNQIENVLIKEQSNSKNYEIEKSWFTQRKNNRVAILSVLFSVVFLCLVSSFVFVCLHAEQSVQMAATEAKSPMAHDCRKNFCVKFALQTNKQNVNKQTK